MVGMKEAAEPEEDLPEEEELEAVIVAFLPEGAPAPAAAADGGRGTLG